VAAKHYLQVTDDHFSKALQKPLQQPAVLPRTGSQSDLALSAQTPVLHGDAADCKKVPERQAPRAGVVIAEWRRETAVGFVGSIVPVLPIFCAGFADL
jgi:hypothetical protein